MRMNKMEKRLSRFLPMLVVLAAAALAGFPLARAAEDPPGEEASKAPAPDKPESAPPAGEESADKPSAKPARHAAPEATPSSGIDESLAFADIPMVISAVKHLQKATEAPSAVTVISAADIERNNYRNLGDALQTVRGFHVFSDRNYNYTGVRGFSRPGDYDTRVLVLVNGHRINDNVYDQFSSDNAWSVDMSLVDHIEIIRGPGSSLYGTNAFFAVVNVITKSPQILGGYDLRVDGGDLGRKGLHLNYGEKFDNGWEVLAGGYALDAKGEKLFFKEFDDPTTNDGVFESGDYESAYKLFSMVKKDRLTMQGFYTWRNKGIPTGSFGTLFNDPNNQTTDVRAFYEGRYERPIDDKRSFVVRGYLDEYNYWGTYIYDNSPSPPIESIERTRGRGIGQEFQFNWKLSEKQRLTLGEQTDRNLRSHMTAYDRNPYYQYLDIDQPFTQSSAYAQDELRLNEHWHLTAGARFDWYSTYGATLNPRLAAVYSPNERTFWKFLAGTAFRGPTTYEQYFEDGLQQVANPDLNPERIQTYEVVLEQQITPRFTSTVSVFQSQISDLISQVDIGGGLFQFQNIDKATTQGVELEGRTRFANGVGGYMSYAFTKAEDGRGDPLTNNSENTVKLGVSAPLLARERLYLSFEGQYYEGRLTLAGDRTSNVFLANLSFHSPALFQKVRLTATVRNLFDEDFFVPGSAEHPEDQIIQEGRTFSLVANYHF